MRPLLLLVASLPGCIVSFPLPEALNRPERELVDATHFHASVVVVPYRYRMYSDRLIDVLRATGLFDAVEPLGEIPDPDLVVRVRGRPGHSNPLPLLPAITFGVVPIITGHEDGEIFSFQSRHAPFVPPDLKDPYRARPPPNAEKDAIRIDSRYDGYVHIGLISVATGLIPGRSWSFPKTTSRYRGNVALHICRRKTEIQALIKRSREDR